MHCTRIIPYNIQYILSCEDAGCQLEASAIVIVRSVCIGVQKQQQEQHLDPCAACNLTSLIFPLHPRFAKKKNLEIIFGYQRYIHAVQRNSIFFHFKLCMTMLIVARAKTASMHLVTGVVHELRFPGQLKRHSRRGSEEAPAAEGSASLAVQTKKLNLDRELWSHITLQTILSQVDGRGEF